MFLRPGRRSDTGQELRPRQIAGVSSEVRRHWRSGGWKSLCVGHIRAPGSAIGDAISTSPRVSSAIVGGEASHVNGNCAAYSGALLISPPLCASATRE
jgi:hypothetical protein